jgi:hypothetical protein
LLIDSAKRTQLVVTTHSDALLSALIEHPSSILVCEHRNGTVLERLDPERLTFWLEAYRLGEVWRIGELGGQSVKEIAIHFEGGGNTAQQKVELRTGLGCLLDARKTAARAKGLGWKLVPSGGRQRAYNALINAMRRGDGTTLNVLLVDSEEALAPEPPPAETESREEKRQRGGLQNRHNL